MNNYTIKYESNDFGTERCLSVLNAEGKLIGMCDPFHVTGVWVSKTKRMNQIKATAQAMIKEHERCLNAPA